MQLPPFRPSYAATALGAVLVAAIGTGCYTSDEGRAPPPTILNFPTGVVVSPGRTVLYIANSDFDLQYNGGTVLALDLPGLRKTALLPLLDALQTKTAKDACASVGLDENTNRILSPGPCTPIGPSIMNSATVGAFASGALYVPRTDAPGARLFVPVRGDPSVTYLDVDDDRDPTKPVHPCGDARGFCLSCGESGTDRRCASPYRVGENPYDNLRRLTLPIEPIGIASTDVQAGGGKASAIVTAHQTEHTASLIENPWDPKTGLDRPTLQFALSALPDGPTEVAAVPVPGLAAADPTVSYQAGFLVSYRATAEIDLLRYDSDAGSKPRRPFLTKAAAAGIAVNAAGNDSRGIAVDGSERAACERGCGVALDPGGCLTDCLDVPLRVFVANRAPASLLLGEVRSIAATTATSTTGIFDIPRIYGSEPLEAGASHVAIGTVLEPDGRPALRVFVVAFDSRFIFSYDPVSQTVDSVIRTGRGPHAIAFDTCVPADVASASSLPVPVCGADETSALPGHSLLFVGHFTDSYVGVVDLDMRHRDTFGNMFASVGAPSAPPESK